MPIKREDNHLWYRNDEVEIMIEKKLNEERKEILILFATVVLKYFRELSQKEYEAFDVFTEALHKRSK